MTTPSARVLVDCGLFQGYKVLRERNRAAFPVPPDSIDAVVISHAHLDHTGYLPALVRDGFRGHIYATHGTAELSGIMLPDSAHLLEEEARFAASHKWSKHAHPEPLYTAADAQRALERFSTIPFDAPRRIAGDVSATLSPAGHILGASTVQLRIGSGRTLQFTGDLGRSTDPLMRPPAPRQDANLVVAESTYGDREHSADDSEVVLGDVIRRVGARGGVVLIPAFAVGRTETVLLHLSRLRDRREIPDIPIFINSPMAANVAELYRRHPEEHRIGDDEIDRMYRLATVVQSVDESKLLNLRGGPMVIISASGMLTGGRILHHLAAYGSDHNNAIVLTGYQAGGTRGAALLAGAGTLRIFGRDVPIRAEVVNLDSLSAHADANEMLKWLKTAPSAPEIVYVTHGEPTAADTLRSRIVRELGWHARVPEHLETVPIG